MECLRAIGVSGDRVLGLVVSETLLKRFPNEREGQISRRYANLVKRDLGSCRVK